jgi:molybdopterin molybdotransferase
MGVAKQVFDYEAGQPTPMLSYEEALACVLELASPKATETVSLAHALGRFLAEDLIAPFPFPRFDNSAVDGYAVRFGPYNIFHQIGIKAAGDDTPMHLDEDECCEVFTGASLPYFTEAVVMKEYCYREDMAILTDWDIEPGQHIRREGEEAQAGDVLIKKGTAVTPPVLGMIASCGLSEFAVHGLPSVSVVTTGDELARVGEELGGSQIYESNSWGIAAAVQSLGLQRPEPIAVADDLRKTVDALERALEADVVICSGGVSVGDRDLVREALEKLGVEQRFWRIAIKPGMPLYFGTLGEKLVFGLPGNPVSALVNFSLFVRPALLKLMGASEVRNKTMRVPLAEPVRKKAGKTEFVRAVMEEGRVRPTASRGSHMLGGLATATGLMVLPPDCAGLEEGALVEYMALNWSGLQ